MWIPVSLTWPVKEMDEEPINTEAESELVWADGGEKQTASVSSSFVSVPS